MAAPPHKHQHMSSEKSTAREGRRTDIPPKMWSDPQWDVLAVSLISYPESNASEETINDTRNMLIAQRTTLGCGSCRNNWRKKMDSGAVPTDADLANRASYERWFCDRFREINVRRRHLTNDEIVSYYVKRLLPAKPVKLLTRDTVILIGVAAVAVLLLRLRRE
jgi:hypothetical protein